MGIHHTDDFDMVATGDAMIARDLQPYAGNATEFDDLCSIIADADAAVTNLEVLVHDYGENTYPTRSLGTFMRAPPSVLDTLSWLGFNLYTTATNHSFDYGYGGLERTMTELDRRNLVYAGVGGNLFEARKPGYVETPAGRVGLLSTCTTINPGSEALPQSEAMGGSPGINALHRDRIYRVTGDQMETLREISEALHIEEIKSEWLERGIYGGHDWLNDRYFHFMDMKLEAVDDSSAVGIYDNLKDSEREDILEWVQETSANAQYTILGIHCHESPLGYHNKPDTPDFLRSFAHECVDAGADAVVGHGPHILRGIEIYDGSPIYYSLGNFIDQREHIERLPPAQYRRHNLGDYSKVSSVFDARSLDADGNMIGDFANPWWWRSVIPRSSYRDGQLQSVELFPLTLQGDAGRPGRGTPVLAPPGEARNILDRIVELSEPFGTDISIEDGKAVIYP